MNIESTFKAGEYWVGDLCYVLQEDWKEVCHLTIPNNISINGEFTLKNGIKFFIGGTANGDGQYSDNKGNNYGVDSGTLGCVLVDSLSDATGNSLGIVHTFKNDWVVSTDGKGLFNFGGIIIDTNFEYDIDDYDNGYRDDEDDTPF